MDSEKGKTDGRERALVQAISKSAQQIWQAGLGAYAKAQQEGGDVYARLVEEGGALQARLQKCAGGGAWDTASRLAAGASRQAAGSLEKLEQVFEERVARSLRKLGMPTQEDIQALATQIRELRETMKRGAPAKTAAKTVRKSAAKATTKAAAAPASRAKPVARATKVNGRRAGSRA